MQKCYFKDLSLPELGLKRLKVARKLLSFPISSPRRKHSTVSRRKILSQEDLRRLAISDGVSWNAVGNTGGALRGCRISWRSFRSGRVIEIQVMIERRIRLTKTAISSVEMEVVWSCDGCVTDEIFVFSSSLIFSISCWISWDLAEWQKKNPSL